MISYCIFHQNKDNHLLNMLIIDMLISQFEYNSHPFDILCSFSSQMPRFPVYTRSGQVSASVDLLTSDMVLSEEEIAQLSKFHHFIFLDVLHLIKDPMDFDIDKSEFGCLVVPLNGKCACVEGHPYIS